MNELSLFSGAGGGLLATHHLLGWRTVGYVEIDEYCQRVLRARIKDGLLDDAPIFPDVRTFDGRPYRGKVDCITAGVPCQRFSSATRGRPTAANFFPDTLRIIADIKPRFVFFENVLGAEDAMRRAGTVLITLGYVVGGPILLSAADLGAPHIRPRLWMLGHSNSYGKSTVPKHEKVARLSSPAKAIWEQADPEDLRMDDGATDVMDRLRAAGQGQVPIVAATAWKILSGEL